MRQPAPAADSAGDVWLHRRLGEREVVGAEANAPVGAEDRAHHVQQRALEVGEGQPLVDREALELVEDRIVRGVDRVAPVAAPERDHVDRRRPSPPARGSATARSPCAAHACRRRRTTLGATEPGATGRTRACRSCTPRSRPRGRRGSRSRGRGTCPRSMRRVWVIGCRWPSGSSSPGSVTSAVSASRRSKASRSSRALRRPAPPRGHGAAGSAPGRSRRRAPGAEPAAARRAGRGSGRSRRRARRRSRRPRRLRAPRSHTPSSPRRRL